ncbi:MAG: helix-turn-helix transcriptional regulator [Clostridia bacterium]|nr:helix-turn-helix transcriptional regulator [Clostridia bacterium]
MLRKENEQKIDKFELNGEWHALVKPSTFDDLIGALRIKDLLLQFIAQHEIDNRYIYCSMLREQETYIEEYMARLGDLDKTRLQSNISFLLKQHDLRIGELEQLLGISSGYISRTAKPGTEKKISVDLVWKIARLFGVEISLLLNADLQNQNSNTELIVRFLDKLRKQTEINVIEWENCGGVMTYLDERFSPQLFINEEDNHTVYTPSHLNPKARFILSNDIYMCPIIDSGKSLAMIQYVMEGHENSYQVDFAFLWPEVRASKTVWHWEKAFSTTDDRFGILKNCINLLIDKVQAQELDTKLSPSTRAVIFEYLK